MIVKGVSAIDLKDVSKTLTASYGMGGADLDIKPLVLEPKSYNITFCDANGTRKDRPNGGLYVNETDTSNTLTVSGVGTYAVDTYNGTIQGDVTATLTTTGGGISSGPSVMQNLPIAWDAELNAREDKMGTLMRGGQGGRMDGVMQTNMRVRRLTPIECERLQGFSDNYTNIKENCPDGHRYKALGNSMAVPVMKWIGQRINELS
jgi:site-specific DNA-cytosine methylase